MQVNEDSMHDAFHAVLDGNDSDNDEALDTTWLPSDCKVNENEKIKTKGKAGSGDLGTGALLTDVDGGYYAKNGASVQISGFKRHMKA